MGLLKLIGAVSAAEHGELRDLLTTVSRERNDALIAAGDAEAKFKLAISDLAARSEQVASLRRLLIDAETEIAALRPNAQKWRDRAARELQRGQAKRDAAAKRRGK